MNTLSKKICFTALFTALTALSTWLIAIPLPASGYFNVGDVFVLLSAWCLGPLYGALAAGLGAATADLLSGFALYAPATLITKAAVALTAYYTYAFFKKLAKNATDKTKPLLTLPSAFLGELLMVLCYLFFESVVLSLGAGAFANVLGNCMQGICATVSAPLVFYPLQQSKFLKNLFPVLLN